MSRLNQWQDGVLSSLDNDILVHRDSGPKHRSRFPGTRKDKAHAQESVTTAVLHGDRRRRDGSCVSERVSCVPRWGPSGRPDSRRWPAGGPGQVRELSARGRLRSGPRGAQRVSRAPPPVPVRAVRAVRAVRGAGLCAARARARSAHQE